VGELGHGDTVTHESPRLIRRLKGKGIEKIFVGSWKSFAIDNTGLLYQWGHGVGFGKIPEAHPFFAKARKGTADQDVILIR